MPCLSLWFACNNCHHLIYGEDLANAQCRICIGGWLYPVSPTAGTAPVPDNPKACSHCGCVYTEHAPDDHLCPLCGTGYVNPIKLEELWVSREEALRQQSESATTAAKPTLDNNTTSSPSQGENTTS